MTETTPRLLPLSTAGCACCAPAHQGREHRGEQAQAPSTGTSTFQVAGMTCGHCSATITAELSAVEGITGVRIELVPGGSSTVTVSADRPISEALIRSAVEKAGYRLAGS